MYTLSLIYSCFVFLPLFAFFSFHFNRILTMFLCITFPSIKKDTLYGQIHF